jgi:Ca2+-binding EF-hand superfamily protein
VNIFRE